MAPSRAQGTKSGRDKHNAQTTNKEHTGQWSSQLQNKAADPDRNAGTAGKKLQGPRSDERNFNLVIDGVPYFIKSIPFPYNDELRFRVFINDETEHVFTWDSEVKMLRAIDDDASMLPDGLEVAISDKLQNQAK
ncbi:MAG TPA: hypothetical protein VFP97_03250 [Chitinophagaceae bacterium]|nr:hypothetical protein [Chitinophagaceae bacterium]